MNDIILTKQGLSDYVSQLMAQGTAPVTASKSGFVKVRSAIPGEMIEVWTKNGNLETIEKASEGDYILTRATMTGVPIIDRYGHINSYMLPISKFEEKYDADCPNTYGVYSPKYIPQLFIQTDRDIEFDTPWGGTMSIKAGGYLNITDPSNIYGIAQEEFDETYRIKAEVEYDIDEER